MALEAQTSFSIDDVAASMIVRSDPAPVQEVDEIEEEDDQAIVEDDSEEEEADASSDEDTTATDDEEADEDDESYETFQLTDDTLVSVTVDGGSQRSHARGFETSLFGRRSHRKATATCY
jgi:hypothetical protein